MRDHHGTAKHQSSPSPSHSEAHLIPQQDPSVLLNRELVIMLECSKSSCNHPIPKETRWIQRLDQALVFMAQPPLPSTPAHPVATCQSPFHTPAHRTHRQRHLHHGQMRRERKAALNRSAHDHLITNHKHLRVGAHAPLDCVHRWKPMQIHKPLFTMRTAHDEPDVAKESGLLTFSRPVCSPASLPRHAASNLSNTEETRNASPIFIRRRSLCVSCRVGPLSQSAENTARAGKESCRDASGGVGRLSYPRLTCSSDPYNNQTRSGR